MHDKGIKYKVKVDKCDGDHRDPKKRVDISKHTSASERVNTDNYTSARERETVTGVRETPHRMQAGAELRTVRRGSGHIEQARHTVEDRRSIGIRKGNRLDMEKGNEIGKGARKVETATRSAYLKDPASRLEAARTSTIKKASVIVKKTNIKTVTESAEKKGKTKNKIMIPAPKIKLDSEDEEKEIEVNMYESTASENENDGKRRRKKERKRKAITTDSDTEQRATKRIDPSLDRENSDQADEDETQITETEKHSETNTLDIRKQAAETVDEILVCITETETTGLGTVTEIMTRVLKIQGLLNETLMRNSYLEGQLKTMTQGMIETQERIETRQEQLEDTITKKLDSIPATKTMTYADRVRVKANTTTQKALKEPKHVVKIMPKETGTYEDSNAIKETIRKIISPQEVGLHVKNIRKINGNGIIIETGKEKDVRTLMTNAKIRDAGLEVGPITKRNPRIIIYDVPRENDDDTIINTIAEQNLEAQNRNKFRKESKVAFATGDRNRNVRNIILEVSREARETIIGKDRIYIGWQCCRIQDYIAATRCYKCHMYGHTTKHCNADKDICGHCGENGHTYRECRKKDRQPTCACCKRVGKPHNHSLRDKTCPAYKAALEQVLRKIDYGY